MEAAIANKNVALTIDNTATKLGNASRGLQSFNGVEKLDNTWVSLAYMNVCVCVCVCARKLVCVCAINSRLSTEK
jgi:hypothetical protein